MAVRGGTQSASRHFLSAFPLLWMVVETLNGERTSVGGWSGCLHVSHEYCTLSRPKESSHKAAGDDGAEHLFLLACLSSRQGPRIRYSLLDRLSLIIHSCMLQHQVIYLHTVVIIASSPTPSFVFT